MKSGTNSEDFLEIIQSISKNQIIKNKISEKRLKYYHGRALAVSSASPDTSTKVGALLIHGESGAVICEGYNGFIRGAVDDKLPMTRPEKYDYIIHAEMNLICNAVRHGVSTDKCVLFCTISPCIKCMRALYQAGISEVYVKGFYSDFEKCSNMLDLSLSVTTLGEFSRIEMKPKRDL
jgi:dCMP deaminase